MCARLFLWGRVGWKNFACGAASALRPSIGTAIFYNTRRAVRSSRRILSNLSRRESRGSSIRMLSRSMCFAILFYCPTYRVSFSVRGIHRFSFWVRQMKYSCVLSHVFAHIRRALPSVKCTRSRTSTVPVFGSINSALLHGVTNFWFVSLHDFPFYSDWKSVTFRGDLVH